MSSQKRRRIQTDDSDDDEPFQPAVDTEAAKGDSDVDYDNNSDDDDNGNNSDSNNNDGSRRNVMRPYLDRMNRRAAGEDDASFSGDDQPDEEEGEGEELINNAEADYVRIDALDQYDTALLDRKDYASMSREDRLKAEEELARREARNRGIEEAIWGGDEENDETREERRRRFQMGGRPREDSEAEEEEEDDDEDLNLEGFDVPLR